MLLGQDKWDLNLRNSKEQSDAFRKSISQNTIQNILQNESSGFASGTHSMTPWRLVFLKNHLNGSSGL